MSSIARLMGRVSISMTWLAARNEASSVLTKTVFEKLKPATILSKDEDNAVTRGCSFSVNWCARCRQAQLDANFRKSLIAKSSCD